MQKFGLFDVIEKILPLTKAINGAEDAPAVKESKPINSQQKKPTNQSNFAPYYSLIKRHDEISKRIDKLKK